MRETMLDRDIAGRRVFAFVDGMYAPYTHQSHLYQTIRDLGYTPDDIGVKIDIAVGGRAGKAWRDGYHMAVVAID